MIKAIKILYGKSRYDVFSLWQKALCQAFLDFDVQTEILSKSQDLLFPPEAKTITLGFNLVRKWSVQCMDQFHIAWLVDHPAYHPELFSHQLSGMPVKMDKLIIGSVDREWVEFAREKYQCPSVHFIPHAATTETLVDSNKTQRTLDVVFFGSIEKIEIFEARLKNLSGNLWPILEKLTNEFSYANPGRLDRLMWDIFTQMGMSPQNTAIAINAFYSNIDRYHICKERIQTLRSIKKTKVHLFGAGPWKEMGLGDNIIIHDSIPYNEVIDVMKRSKLLLNHTPSLQDGGHERIFEALVNGCAVLTTPSRYINEEFGCDAGVRFYRGSSEPDMDKLIDSILRDNTIPELLAVTQNHVISNHHMKNRAARICKLVEERWPDIFK